MSRFMMMEQLDDFFLYCTKCDDEVSVDVTKNGPHLSARCGNCGKWIKHVPKHQSPGDAEITWENLLDESEPVAGGVRQ